MTSKGRNISKQKSEWAKIMSDRISLEKGPLGPARFVHGPRVISLRDDIRTLKKWSPVLSKGRIPTIEGDLIDPNTNLPFRDRWSSSRLVDGEGRSVKTKSGCKYTLEGPPHFVQSTAYPNYIYNSFKNGFPRNWKELFDKWGQDAKVIQEVNEGSDKYAKSELSSKISCALVTPLQQNSTSLRPAESKQVKQTGRFSAKDNTCLSWMQEMDPRDPKFQPIVPVKRLSLKRLKSKRYTNFNLIKNGLIHEKSDNLPPNNNERSDTDILKEFQVQPKSVKQTRKNAKILQQINGNHDDNLFDLHIESQLGKNTVNIDELFESDSDQDISVNTPRTPIIVNSTSDPDIETEREEIKKTKKLKKFKEDAYVFKKSLDLKKGRKLLSTINREPVSFRSHSLSVDRRKKLEKKAVLLTRPISHLLNQTDNAFGEDSSDEESGLL